MDLLPETHRHQGYDFNTLYIKFNIDIFSDRSPDASFETNRKNNPEPEKSSPLNFSFSAVESVYGGKAFWSPLVDTVTLPVFDASLLEPDDTSLFLFSLLSCHSGSRHVSYCPSEKWWLHRRHGNEKKIFWLLLCKCGLSFLKKRSLKWAVTPRSFTSH